MNVNERALHIQLESYRQALSELSTRMAEAIDKHIAELKQSSTVQADLEARLQEVSASAMRAVQMYNDAKANSDEVVGKFGALTVENRDLKNELAEAQETTRRRFLISGFLFRAASRGLDTIYLPAHPAVSPAAKRESLDMERLSFAELSDYIYQFFLDVSVEQLDGLLEEEPTRTVRGKKGK